MNKNVFDTDTFKSDYRSLIVLYGRPSCGKTTTLMQLLRLLFPAQKIDIDNMFVIKTKTRHKYTDARFIFKYRGLLIFLSTYGDSRGICERNFKFFQREFASTGIIPIYLIDSVDGINKINKNDWLIANKDVIPNICISASRNDASIIDPLMYFGRDVVKSTFEQDYIQKFGYLKDDNDIFYQKIEYILDQPANSPIPLITVCDDLMAKRIISKLDEIASIP